MGLELKASELEAQCSNHSAKLPSLIIARQLKAVIKSNCLDNEHGHWPNNQESDLLIYIYTLKNCNKKIWPVSDECLLMTFRKAGAYSKNKCLFNKII